MNNRWLQNLNTAQIEAVSHDHGPLLILAGAGSGKTTVLVARTGRLIAEKVVTADRVVVLTFTNKAARELKSRVQQKLGMNGAQLWASTFHSFGLNWLRKNHKAAGLLNYFGLLDPTDANALVKEILKDIRMAGKDAFDTERLLSRLSFLREGKKMAPDMEDEYLEMAEVILPKYMAAMKRLGVVDFDELILAPTKLLNENDALARVTREQIEQLMVDEFQDTNSAQMDLVKAVLGKNNNIAVVGDDDQSIYGWRGAEIQNILNFPKMFKPCKVVRLEQNYRSSPPIVAMANAVIASNADRHKKVLKATQRLNEDTLPEVFVYETDDMESEEITYQIQHFLREGFKAQDIAVLFRSNMQSNLLEAALRRQRIAYRITGGTQLFDRKEVRDVLAYLRCAVAPNELALRRIVNVPARSIGDQTLEALESWAIKNKSSFRSALENWRAAGVAERSGESIEQFLNYLKVFPERLLSGDVTQNWQSLFTQVGYFEHLRHLYKPEGAKQRWDHVLLIGRIISDFVAQRKKQPETLREFLDLMELRDRQDEDEENKKNQVQLLTLHASKGLEWPVVILMGVEEDLLPHRKLGKDISEERRLFYVGVTRAKQRLVLTRAKQRLRYGRLIKSAPSRFLVEVDRGLYREYPDGCRPAVEGQRRSMLDSLYKKLDQKIADQQEVDV